VTFHPNFLPLLFHHMLFLNPFLIRLVFHPSCFLYFLRFPAIFFILPFFSHILSYPPLYYPSLSSFLPFSPPSHCPTLQQQNPRRDFFSSANFHRHFIHQFPLSGSSSFGVAPSAKSSSPHKLNSPPESGLPSFSFRLAHLSSFQPVILLRGISIS
jgi:hypothetical protein